MDLKHLDRWEDDAWSTPSLFWRSTTSTDQTSKLTGWGEDSDSSSSLSPRWGNDTTWRSPSLSWRSSASKTLGRHEDNYKHYRQSLRRVNDAKWSFPSLFWRSSTTTEKTPKTTRRVADNDTNIRHSAFWGNEDRWRLPSFKFRRAKTSEETTPKTVGGDGGTDLDHYKLVSDENKRNEELAETQMIQKTEEPTNGEDDLIKDEELMNGKQAEQFFPPSCPRPEEILSKSTNLQPGEADLPCNSIPEGQDIVEEKSELPRGEQDVKPEMPSTMTLTDESYADIDEAKMRYSHSKYRERDEVNGTGVKKRDLADKKVELFDGVNVRTGCGAYRDNETDNGGTQRDTEPDEVPKSLGEPIRGNGERNTEKSSEDQDITSEVGETKISHSINKRVERDKSNEEAKTPVKEDEHKPRTDETISKMPPRNEYQSSDEEHVSDSSDQCVERDKIENANEELQRPKAQTDEMRSNMTFDDENCSSDLDEAKTSDSIVKCVERDKHGRKISRTSKHIKTENNDINTTVTLGHEARISDAVQKCVERDKVDDTGQISRTSKLLKTENNDINATVTLEQDLCPSELDEVRISDAVQKCVERDKFDDTGQISRTSKLLKTENNDINATVTLGHDLCPSELDEARISDAVQKYIERDKVDDTGQIARISEHIKSKNKGINASVTQEQDPCPSELDEARISDTIDNCVERDKVDDRNKEVHRGHVSKKVNGLLDVALRLLMLAACITICTGTEPGHPFRLRQGENASIEYSLNIPTSTTYVPSFAIKFDSMQHPFCINHDIYKEGLKEKSQLERFNVSSAVSQNTISVTLKISSVTVFDQGVYVLTLTLYSSEDVLQETVRKSTEVRVPPGLAQCYITFSDYVHLKELHCHATLGNCDTSLLCFQDHQKVPYKGEILNDDIAIRGVFWMNPESPIYCCSHDNDETLEEGSCKDYYWAPEPRKISPQPASTPQITEGLFSTASTIFPETPIHAADSGSYGLNHCQIYVTVAISVLTCAITFE